MRMSTEPAVTAVTLHALTMCPEVGTTIPIFQIGKWGSSRLQTQPKSRYPESRR